MIPANALIPWYHFEKTNAYFYDPDYKIIDEDPKRFEEPLVSLKDLKSLNNGITYRKINDWDAKGLISGSRKTVNTGWRKFSVIDIVKLNIISDLRDIGLSIERISLMLKNIEVTDIENMFRGTEEVHFKFQQLKFFILKVLLGNKILLMINKDNQLFFFSEKDAISNYYNFDFAINPVITLPFFLYICEIEFIINNKIVLNPDSTIEGLNKYIYSNKERRILEIISNKEFSEISIIKKDGDNILIKTKTKKLGKFSNEEVKDLIKSKDFQKVSVSTSDGNIIAIEQEVSIKV